MHSMHNIGRNSQKLRDVLKEISANTTPKSASEIPKKTDDNTNKSKKKSDKRKSSQPDRKPKKTKTDTATSKIVTWDCTLCPGLKFSDNQEFM